jgi:hypothetical protein
MGGRISGDSPREENISDVMRSNGPGRLYNFTEAVVDATTAAVAGQASWQQFAACVPAGQQES